MIENFVLGEVRLIWHLIARRGTLLTFVLFFFWFLLPRCFVGVPAAVRLRTLCSSGNDKIGHGDLDCMRQLFVNCTINCMVKCTINCTFTYTINCTIGVHLIQFRIFVLSAGSGTSLKIVFSRSRMN